MTGPVTLRPATAADEPFVDGLLREDAEALLATAPLALRAGLVELQVRARRLGYGRDWPDAVDHVIEVDGCAVGRLLAVPVRRGVQVVDVRVAADRRGEGIGATALRQVIDEADAAGIDVTLRVDPGSPARVLYGRLGFQEVPEDVDAVDVLMRHQPR